MSIFDDVNQQMKDALKARDAQRLAALRSIRAAFLNETKKDNSEDLEDAVCVGLLRRLEKQRRESIEAFEKAEREDRVGVETAELGVIPSFLPSLANEATTRGWVEAAIAESGASSAKELGKVMGALMKAHKGDVDGNLARQIATELLAD